MDVWGSSAIDSCIKLFKILLFSRYNDHKRDRYDNYPRIPNPIYSRDNRDGRDRMNHRRPP